MFLGKIELDKPVFLSPADLQMSESATRPKPTYLQEVSPGTRLPKRSTGANQIKCTGIKNNTYIIFVYFIY